MSLDIRMGWKPFLLALLWLIVSNREDIERAFDGVKKNGKPVNAKRETFIEDNVNNDLQDLCDEIYKPQNERIVINGRRRVLS